MTFATPTLVRFFAIPLVAFAVPACGADSTAETDSLPPTGELAPSFSATADEDHFVVSGGLIGNGREQEISGGARLVAAADGTHAQMMLVPNAETFAYDAELPLPNGETTLTVALERANGASATDSSVVVPAPFGIVEVPSALPASGEITIVLTRAPAPGERVRLLLSGCFQPRHFEPNVNGARLTFTIDDLDPVKSCLADAELDITRDGALDQRFAHDFVYGGEGPPQPARFVARQLRKTKLQVDAR